MGNFNLGVVFFPRLSVCNLARGRWGFGAGGRYAVLVRPPAPSYPVRDDGFAGGRFCGFSVAFGGCPFLLRFAYYPYPRTLAIFAYTVPRNPICDQCRTWAGEEGVSLLLTC